MSGTILQDLILNAYQDESSMEKLKYELERRMRNQEYANDIGLGASNEMARPSLEEAFANILGQELPNYKTTIKGLFQSKERPQDIGGHGLFKSIWDAVR